MIDPENETDPGYPPTDISALPAELLSLIFWRNLQGIFVSWDHYRELHTLMLVCSHWRNIANATPLLWSFIDICFPSEIVDRLLAQSANHPFTIMDRRREVKSRLSLNERQTNLELIVPHTTRCNRIDVFLVSDEERRLVESFSAPLNVYSLSIAWHDAWSKTWDYSTPTLPVEYLSLSGVNIPWSHTLLSGLRSMELSFNWWRQPWLNRPEHILEAISRCPDLLYLRIAGLQDPDGESQPAFSGVQRECIRLPDLLSIELEDGVPGVFFPLLSHIDAPNLSELKLHHNEDWAESTGLSMAVHCAYFKMILSRFFLTSDTLRIEFPNTTSTRLILEKDVPPTSWSAGWFGIPLGWGSNIPSRSGPLFPPLTWLVDNILDGSVRNPSKITIYGTEEASSDMILLLARLSGITTLHLIDYSAKSWLDGIFLEALEPEWPCFGELEQICLETPVDEDTIIHFLKRRYVPPASRYQLDSPPLPLKVLNVRPNQKIDRIRGLLSDIFMPDILVVSEYV